MIYIKYDNQGEKEFVMKMVGQMNLDSKEITIDNKINFVGLRNVPNSITGANSYAEWKKSKQNTTDNLLQIK